jgi:hypothetical protein
VFGIPLEDALSAMIASITEVKMISSMMSVADLVMTSLLLAG